MARTEMATVVKAPLGGGSHTEALLKLGLRYAAEDTSADRVLAHKWFNIAATLGNPDASRMRREIAGEMTAGEVAAAQRAAREWFTLH